MQWPRPNFTHFVISDGFCSFCVPKQRSIVPIRHASCVPLSDDGRLDGFCFWTAVAIARRNMEYGYADLTSLTSFVSVRLLSSILVFNFQGASLLVSLIPVRWHPHQQRGEVPVLAALSLLSFTPPRRLLRHLTVVPTLFLRDFSITVFRFLSAVCMPSFRNGPLDFPTCFPWSLSLMNRLNSF